MPQMLTLLLLLLSSSLVTARTFSLPKAHATSLSGPVVGNVYDIDPLDTLDEEDVFKMRDTTMVSRRNVATDINALDYILDDRLMAKHEGFTNKFWDHVFVGLGGSYERIVPLCDGYKIKGLSGLSLNIGKTFKQHHTLRLSLGGAWGYQEEKEYWLARLSGKLDYIYSVSGFYKGYRPSRTLDFGIFTGVGMHYTKKQTKDYKMVPEMHFGLQFKFFTSPRGYFNIEPYVGISGDQLDISEKRNWRQYDLFYGLNMNYIYYLRDNMSPQSKLRLLEEKTAKQRLVNDKTIDIWRTPWFFEFSMGPAFSRSEELSMGSTMGHETTFSVGRWISPVLGFRGSITSRDTKWQKTHHDMLPGIPPQAEYDVTQNAHYCSGRIDALLNPFGFSRKFSWDAKMGAYLVFGAEYGWLTKHQPGIKLRTRSESYNLGLHLWTKLTEDMHLFVEPRYIHGLYYVPYSNVTWNKLYRENSFSVDLGFTMLIRSEKFHDVDEFDDMQDFMHSELRGFRVGALGGMTLLQLTENDYGSNSFPWNGTVQAEFRFNKLHSVRAAATWMPLKRNYLSSFTDNYVNDFGESMSNSRHGMWETNRNLLIAQLNYQVSLTNLMSGRLNGRKCELEGFIGPAVGFVLNSKYTLSPKEEYAEGHTYTMHEKDPDKLMYGFNAGLKLTRPLTKHWSVIMEPTVFFLKTDKPMLGVDVIHAKNFRMYQTLQLGFQYKIGSFRPNYEKMRARRARWDKKWNARQQKKDAKYDEKLKRQAAKRHARYEKSRR